MRAMLVLAVLAALVAAGTFFDPALVRADASGRWIVKLYSGPEVVGTWESLGPGKIDGGTLYFLVEQGVRTKEMRISGTYSVEPKP
jgi:hypothetical protein